MDQAKEMAKIAFEALEDKKGENVCAIDISSVSVLADYFAAYPALCIFSSTFSTSART